jgi:hypothetical protein
MTSQRIEAHTERHDSAQRGRGRTIRHTCGVGCRQTVRVAPTRLIRAGGPESRRDERASTAGADVGGVSRLVVSGSVTVGERLSRPSWLAGGPPLVPTFGARAVVIAGPRATVAATRTPALTVTRSTTADRASDAPVNLLSYCSEL